MNDDSKIKISAPIPDDELLERIGVHVDYVEALSKGEPFGADVINFPGAGKNGTDDPNR